MYFAGGQLDVFQGASEAPISESYGSSEQRGPGPEGCDENGPAAALLVGHVSIQICSLLAPCRRPILIATKHMLFRGQDTNKCRRETREIWFDRRCPYDQIRAKVANWRQTPKRQGVTNWVGGAEPGLKIRTSVICPKYRTIVHPWKFFLSCWPSVYYR
jgi:hypothetical protein